MTGIDTNVIIRYIVQDDPEQSLLATQFMEKEISAAEPGVVNAVVLCEVVWVLRGAYGYTKPDIVRVLEALLSAAEIDLPRSEAAWKALYLFKRGAADFSDYFLAEINADHGCDTTVTFDKKAGNHSLFTLLD